MGREIGSSVEYVVVTGATKTLGMLFERGYLVDVGTIAGHSGRIIVRIGDERHYVGFGKCDRLFCLIMH